MNAGTPLALSSIDRAFYAALKLHVYHTIHDSLLATLLGGTPITVNEAVKLEVGRFTARKASFLFVGENGSKPRTSSDFYGFTSHKVREKLTYFAELGVVDLVGKGLRDAFTYKWRPPVKHWEICSFLKVLKHTGSDLSMNHELNRIYHGLGFEPFTFAEFLGTYEEAHASEFGGSRWGRRKYEALRDSFGYQSFLKTRLERLVEEGLVLSDRRKGPAKHGPDGKAAPESFTLNPAIADVLNHFDLFVNEVAFHPSREMCGACKLDGLCRAGSTQLLVVALNRAPKNAATVAEKP